MCGKCPKKNLELDLPDSKQLKKVKDIFIEYAEKRKINNLTYTDVFNYFNIIYGTDYVENPENIRRATTNMDKLFYAYRESKNIFS